MSVGDEVAEWVELLKEQREALEPVRGGTASWLIERRTKDEVHLCLRDMTPARVAYIGQFERGPRWVDLCAPCDSWLRAGLAELERRELPPKAWFYGHTTETEMDS